MVADDRIRSDTCAGVRRGDPCKTNAAAPATWGAAIEVPFFSTLPVDVKLDADLIELPGATRSTHDPWFEYTANWSVEVDAATVMAEGTRAGE